MNRKLPLSFYLREDVLHNSRELIGKFLVTNFDGIYSSGMIAEVEGYDGAIDRASHAFRGRRTPRNEIMYAHGGTAYVYLCYGIHHLFNVVTNKKNIPHAILIRAIEPVDGIEHMMKRRKMTKLNYTLTRGPGSLAQALGISTKHNGIDLLGNKIWIEDRGIKIPSAKIISGKRVGVEGAGEAAHYLYRYYIKRNLWVSSPR